MRKIRKGQYGFPVITVSPKEYLNKGAEVILKAMEPVGKAMVKGVAGLGNNYGTSSVPYAPRTVQEANRQAKELRVREEQVEKAMPYLSPSNHVVAWTQSSWNPKVGQLKIAEWGPLALLGSLGVDAIGFKYVPKGVKAATKNGKAYVISKTIDKAVRENTPKADNRIHSVRIDDKIYDYSSNPLLEFVETIRTSPTNSYFMRTPSKIGITKLRNGRFRHEVVGNNILPSGEVNGKFVSYGEPWKEFGFNEESALYEFPVGPKRGPYMMATDWKGRSKNYSAKEAYDYMKLEELLKKDLRQLNEQMGELFDKNYATIRNNLIESKYPLLKEHIDTSIYGGNQTVIPSLKWNFDNFLNSPFYKYTIDPISNQVQKELFIPGILKSAKQQRVISKGTYPWYRGKQYSVKEVVNPDGTVNPRLAMRILHEVSKLFPGSHKMEHRLENPEWHKTDPTTYDHTKNVALSAWGLDVPYGFTKHDLMVAALGHDFGKIVAGDGHAQIGADLARQVFPDLTDAQYTAIAEHMGTPRTPLGKATKAADIDNGRSVIRRSGNEINISPQELFKALRELEGYYFLGHGTGRTGVNPQTIFDNGLRVKGGDITNTTMPLSESNLISWPHMNSEEIIIMPGKAAMTKYDSAHGHIPSDWYSDEVFHWTDNPRKIGSGPFAAYEPNAYFTEQIIGGVPGVYTKPEAVLGSYNTKTHILRFNPRSQYKFTFKSLVDKKKKGGKTHKPFGHRSILDNGWQSTKLLKNKKNVYGK